MLLMAQEERNLVSDLQACCDQLPTVTGTEGKLANNDLFEGTKWVGHIMKDIASYRVIIMEVLANKLWYH